MSINTRRIFPKFQSVKNKHQADAFLLCSAQQLPPPHSANVLIIHILQCSSLYFSIFIISFFLLFLPSPLHFPLKKPPISPHKSTETHSSHKHPQLHDKSPKTPLYGHTTQKNTTGRKPPQLLPAAILTKLYSLLIPQYAVYTVLLRYHIDSLRHGDCRSTRLPDNVPSCVIYDYPFSRRIAYL